jgi:hypothetical protein
VRRKPITMATEHATLYAVGARLQGQYCFAPLEIRLLLRGRPLRHLHEAGGAKPFGESRLDLHGGELQISPRCQGRLVERQIVCGPPEQPMGDTVYARL